MANITRMNVMITANAKGLTTGLSTAEKSIASFSSKASMRLSSMAGSFSRIGTGLSKITGPLSAGLSKFTSMAQTGLTRVGIAATGAAAGLAYLTKTSIDAIGDANDFSKSIGLSYNALRRIQKAAQMSGVSLETTNSALMKMSDTLGTAFGGNQAAVDSFEKIGLDIEKLKQMAPEQQFLAIAQAINQIKDPAAKVAAARDIFGKSGGLLISFFGSAGESITAAQKALDTFGVSLSQLDVERIDEAGDSMGEFKFITEGVGNQLAKHVSKYITKISKDTLAWLESMGGIDDIVNRGLSRMGGALKTILDKMVYVQAAWRLVKDIVESVVGVFDMLPESIKKAIKAAATWNPIRDALVGDIEKHRKDIEREGSGVAGFRNRAAQWGQSAITDEEQSAQDRVQSDHDRRRDERIERERKQERDGIQAGREGQAAQLSPSQQRAQEIIQGAQRRGVMPSGPLNRGKAPQSRGYFERMGIPDPRFPAQTESAPMQNQSQSNMNGGSEELTLLRGIYQNTGKNAVGFAG